MKNLLFKELRLCVPAQAWIYFALVARVLIPGWPPIVGLFYVTVSVMIIFPIAHANRDALFTALLPVRKQDAVKGKVILISFLELAAAVFALPLLLVRHFLINPALMGDPESAEMLVGSEVNFALLGAAFFMYGAFNLVFFPWYYKKASRGVIPQLVSMFVVMVIMVLYIGITTGSPAVSAAINDFSFPGIFIQLGVFLFGILFFVGATALASRLAGKAFEKLDL